MASINDALYQKIREKVKEHKLSEEEIHAVDTARRQLNSHTQLGGFAGATTAFMLGRRRKFSPFQILALTGGGFLIGSQLGMVSGALAGVKTIKEVPNPQRLVRLFNEVQNDVMTAKGYKRDAVSGRPRPMTVEEREQQQQEQLDHHSSFSSDDSSLHGEHQRPQESGFPNRDSPFSADNAWNQPKPTPSIDTNNNGAYGDEPATPQTDTQPQYASAWDKIRANNAPNNSWAKLRMQARQNPPETQTDTTPYTSRLRQEEPKDVEELPRTREEAEQMGSNRRNQWGDPL